MKLSQKSYPIMGLLGALLASAVVAGCAIGPTSETAQTNAANRVLGAYNVPDLLSQAAPAVSESLDNNLPDDVSTADRQRLRDVIFDVYAPETLQADVARNLREQAAQANRKEALASAAETLEAPLPTRMIGLEEAAGNENFADGFSEFASQPASESRKERLQVINGLASDMQFIELQTGFNVTLLEAMISARNAAAAEQYQVDPAQVERMVSNTREGIRGKLEKQVPLMLLYVYRNVDDATLEQYADLQSQPDMVWTNQALEQAITGALAVAGDKIPEHFNSEP